MVATSANNNINQKKNSISSQMRNVGYNGNNDQLALNSDAHSDGGRAL